MFYPKTESHVKWTSGDSFRELSLKQNPLRNNNLVGYSVPHMTESAAERARERIRAEMAKKRLSQRDVAGILNWSQSRVSKNLNAHIELGVDDLAGLCFAVGIPLTEAVRDRGLEFCAEMTPTELRILERIRQFPPQMKDAMMMVLQLHATTPAPERYAKKRASKMLNRASSAR